MLYPNPYGWNLFVKQKVIEGELQKERPKKKKFPMVVGVAVEAIVYVKKICFN
jgi:hypothetical protein